MKKIAIIFNPKAGSGKKATLDRIIKKLSSTNKVELFETKAKGDATNISRKESDNFDENEEAKRITYFSIMNNKRVIFAFLSSIVTM